MNCELCQNEIGSTSVCLPIKQLDGKLETLACMDCSINSGVYCLEHQRPNLGFEDGTSACTECIEQVVRENGEKIAGQIAIRVHNSPKRIEIETQVDRWWEMIQEMSSHPTLGDLTLVERTLSVRRLQNIARLVITKALRKKSDPDVVIDEVVTQGPQVILPDLELF